MNPGRGEGSAHRGVISHFVNATACSDVWAGLFLSIRKSVIEGDWEEEWEPLSWPALCRPFESPIFVCSTHTHARTHARTHTHTHTHTLGGWAVEQAGPELTGQPFIWMLVLIGRWAGGRESTVKHGAIHLTSFQPTLHAVSFFVVSHRHFCQGETRLKTHSLTRKTH